MKHTPGPWKTGARMTRVEVLPDGWRVPMCIADCDANAMHPPESEPERVANARLIAAAPDLLELLENILRRLDLEPPEAIFPCSAMREEIRTAIAKAKAD